MLPGAVSDDALPRARRAGGAAVGLTGAQTGRRVHQLWVGGPLSWLERLSVVSHLAQGHPVTLWGLGPFAEPPEEVELGRARDLLAPPFPLRGRHALAVYSDLVRLALLERGLGIWADMDAVATGPLPDAPHLIGRGPKGLLTGVLALPPDSPALAAMGDFCRAPCPIQPWRNPGFQARRAAARDGGARWGIVDLPWGCSGPKALTHFAALSGEDRHALPRHVLYPLAPRELPLLHVPDLDPARIVRPGTRSVHVFGSQRLWLAQANRGLPVPGSWLARACAAHGIDPAAHPIGAPSA
ncbi:MAG: hypothetical protein ACU0BF_04890 [Paracoccaceae bacterium]